MLSVFRVTTVWSIFVIRYFADAPFFNCLAGRIGSQVGNNLPGPPEEMQEKPKKMHLSGQPPGGALLR